MVRSLIPVLLAALAGTSPLLAQTPQPPTAGAAAIDKTSQTEDVQFRTEAYDRMTVPVLLSGAGPYRFLVDTGANRTAISRQLASELNLRSGDKAVLHSVAGESLATTAIVPNLQLTHRPVRSIEAPLLEKTNMGADGILGTDALGQQRVVFDFASQTMSVVPSNSFTPSDEPGTIVIEGRRRNGRLIITDAVANGHKLTVILDTGSEVTVGNEALRAVLSKGGLRPLSQPVALYSVTGEMITGDYMFVREMEIGGVTLENLAIVFAPVHTFRQLKLENRPAVLLGMNAMRAFKKVSIDFANLTMRVVVPETSSLDVQLAERGWPQIGR
ncbi:MAG TPA: retroviral-like aspartic protease family protein [Sphingomicrobium sp.]|jgi:predicted aspartyl protease|nr:retroviral-like aspartic protease family protein [Sphingomicrobium sp.]